MNPYEEAARERKVGQAVGVLMSLRPLPDPDTVDSLSADAWVKLANLIHRDGFSELSVQMVKDRYREWWQHSYERVDTDTWWPPHG